MSENYKIIVKRPLRLCVDLREETLDNFKNKLASKNDIEAKKQEQIFEFILAAKARIIEALPKAMTTGIFKIYTVFNNLVNQKASEAETEITQEEKLFIREILTFKDEKASEVIQRANFPGEEAPMFGIFKRHIHGKDMLVEYEEDLDLREEFEVDDTTSPEDFFQTQVASKNRDAWIETVK